jgi:hypothetical protein
MMEFGMLQLRSLLNNFAGLTGGGKFEQRQRSNQNNLLYSISHAKASMKIISPLAQRLAWDPPEAKPAIPGFKDTVNAARLPSESV